MAASPGVSLLAFCMKPLLALTTASALPVIGLVVLGHQPGFADSDRASSDQQLLLAALPAVQSHFWIQTKSEISLEALAAEVGLPAQTLAQLNEKGIESSFGLGQWLMLPNRVEAQLNNSTALDRFSVRRTAPLTAPPAAVAEIKVRDGESFASIARKHGLTTTELRKLNPGLDLARLVVGSQIRVAEAAPRQLLAIRPSVSGGASWPELPGLPGADRKPMAKQSFIWPTKGVFTSGYGWRWGRMHKGIDIANNVGTPIQAAKDGVVVFSGWSSGYGYLVELSHGDGTSTRYAHNSRLIVRKGQVIPQGATISLMGSTGRSTGPHLHFEIRQPGGAASDPMAFLPSRRA
ncbi:peptidoglycan DD-metalloendopeptidase family protein [Synechococcus sp. BS56D]|uniref:peptidoglycan DD-metalloendopeptidase family protein n=1 Tax=Synechococcus sp. BS56D TaxID=2055944 RepID=UPI003517B3E2